MILNLMQIYNSCWVLNRMLKWNMEQMGWMDGEIDCWIGCMDGWNFLTMW